MSARKNITVYPVKPKKNLPAQSRAFTKKGRDQVVAMFRAPAPPAFSTSSLRSGAATDSEIKAVDVSGTALGFYPGSGPPSGILLNGVTQGSGFYERVGARINMQSLRFRLNIAPVSSVAADTLRVLLVYDRQTNGSTPSWSSVMQNRDSTGAATNTVYAWPNLDNRDRFHIVRDYLFHAPSVTVAAGIVTTAGPSTVDNTKILIDDYIPLSGLVTHYKATSSPPVVGDTSTGGLFLYVCSDVSSNIYRGTLSSRLRYSDR